MIDQFHFAKDFHNVTTIHPVGLMSILLCVFSVMVVPRRFVLLPVIVIACVIAPSQRVVLAGMDFTFLRIITTVGCLRVLLRDEHRGFRLILLDKVLLAWVAFSGVAYILLYQNMASIVYQLGFAFDAILTYFLVRFVVRDLSDITALARGVAIIAVPVAVAMSSEFLSGYNVFSVFGGVPEQTLERYGRVRAQAAFSHPIVAGTFWAALIPIMLAGVRRGVIPIATTSVGVISALIVIWCTTSSTPMTLVAVVAIAAMLYPVRSVMPWLRIGMVVMLATLHLVMIAPVWHLFARINIYAGSTGWWRYLIIDRFVDRWQEWFLIGTTRSSGWLAGNTFNDVTNQYVVEGINGGIVKLLLFLAILVLCFSSVGRAIRGRESTAAAPVHAAGDGVRRWTAWCIGTMITVHVAAYFATGYFGQLTMLHYLTFGLAACMPSVIGHRMVRGVPCEDEPTAVPRRRIESDGRTGPLLPVPGPAPALAGGRGGAGRPSIFRPI